MAVIGPDAVEARLGGYSGPGIRKVSLLDAMRATAEGRDTIAYAAGCGRSVAAPAADRRARICGPNRDPAASPACGASISPTSTSRASRSSADRPAGRFPLDLPALRPRAWGRTGIPSAGPGRSSARPTGSVEIGVEGNDGVRLSLDGRLIVDQWSKQTRRALTRNVRLEKGRAYDSEARVPRAGPQRRDPPGLGLRSPGRVRAEDRGSRPAGRALGSGHRRGRDRGGRGARPGRHPPARTAGGDDPADRRDRASRPSSSSTAAAPSR